VNLILLSAYNEKCRYLRYDLQTLIVSTKALSFKLNTYTYYNNTQGGLQVREREIGAVAPCVIFIFIIFNFLIYILYH